MRCFDIILRKSRLKGEKKHTTISDCMFVDDLCCYSNSTKPNQFCLEIILCRIRGAFEYLMYPYYPAYMG